jgi:predicted N-formylglutamate amidohydrolase
MVSRVTSDLAQAHVTSPAIVISCEHGGNRIPAEYRKLFETQRATLESHRGLDAGALSMARTLASDLDAPLLAATTSRLLVDLNRSAGHPALHAAVVRQLPPVQRERIVDRHHRPYRERAERLMRRAIAESGSVIHLSCHSFTPHLDGHTRMADIGLLYDPARSAESALCAEWKHALEAALPALRVRRNYPYRGSNDGLTTWLRSHLHDNVYRGIEIEINQQLLDGDMRAVHAALADSLRMAITKTLAASRCAAGSPATADTGVRP